MVSAEIDELWAKIARGDAIGSLQPHQEVALLSRAERAAKAAEVADRRVGLRIADTVGGRDRLAVMACYLADPDVSVRRDLFERACAARADGIGLLRDLAADPDLSLALEVLALLRTAVDKGATRKLRGLLTSPHAAVRAAAVDLLGHVAGKTVTPDIEPLLSDADPAVSSAARTALDRIAGKLPKDEPKPWYPEQTALAPVSDEPVKPRKKIEVPGRAPAPDKAAAEALLRRLGESEPDTRRGLDDALQQLGEPALTAAMHGWRPGSDPALGRGIAWCAEQQSFSHWTSTLRRQLTDPAAGVREAAVASLSRIGAGMSVVQAVAARLADPEARVRIAAIDAVCRLCQDLGRPEIARQRLDALKSDADAAVQAARAAALTALTALG
jgi:HEAT repeat protein